MLFLILVLQMLVLLLLAPWLPKLQDLAVLQDLDLPPLLEHLPQLLDHLPQLLVVSVFDLKILIG